MLDLSTLTLYTTHSIVHIYNIYNLGKASSYKLEQLLPPSIIHINRLYPYKLVDRDKINNIVIYLVNIINKIYNNTNYTILEEKVRLFYEVLYLEPLETDLIDITYF
ncbi:hypothetical protein DPV78_000133 [Talaromyces pinophilus]|nr:hypothetical protein DPV78_000133 [Talaromyces pinophilus]